MKKLKEKWGIKSNFQIIIILIVFSITGALAVIIAKPLLKILGLNSNNTSLWIYIPIRIIIIFPLYQILILIVGSIFGQFDFFWKFEKKMLSRLGFKKLQQKN
tara:strand:+ start:879 stop:1187 length:309 start_codon:yes stop_codon:yes gene_type:complete